VERVTGLIIVAAAAALIGAHPSSSARTQQGCPAGFVPARIAGHSQCLQEGATCKRKLDRAYHRYYFHCHRGYLTFAWNLLRRPFHISSLTPGAQCPTTLRTGTLSFGIPGLPAWGPGPAYPTSLGDGPTPIFSYFDQLDPASVYGTEWGGQKALWLIQPGNFGHILIRGKQLDGPNQLRFEDGVPAFTSEEALHPSPELQIRFGGDHPAATRIRAPGCYAYQIDAVRFSYDIVFEARSVGSEPHA
jgi:hypothetical protein